MEIFLKKSEQLKAIIFTKSSTIDVYVWQSSQYASVTEKCQFA